MQPLVYRTVALLHSMAFGVVNAHERRVAIRGRGATMLEYALLTCIMGVLTTFLLKPFGYNLRWRLLQSFNHYFNRFPNP